MAKYSAINLLDKIFIFRTVFKEFPDFPNTPHFYLLLAVKALKNRYKETNKFTISLFLRANGHSSGFKVIDKTVDYFVAKGFLRKDGVNGRRIYITPLGLNTLNEMEAKIRTSHFKFRRGDSNRVKPPGRKKGAYLKSK